MSASEPSAFFKRATTASRGVFADVVLQCARRREINLKSEHVGKLFYHPYPLEKRIPACLIKLRHQIDIRQRRNGRTARIRAKQRKMLDALSA